MVLQVFSPLTSSLLHVALVPTLVKVLLINTLMVFALTCAFLLYPLLFRLPNTPWLVAAFSLIYRGCCREICLLYPFLWSIFPLPDVKNMFGSHIIVFVGDLIGTNSLQRRRCCSYLFLDCCFVLVLLLLIQLSSLMSSGCWVVWGV